MNRTYKKWTASEDDILLQQVRQYPSNLTRCFIAVSNTLGRSPSSIANRWYTVVSKKPDSTCFFTASQEQISINRKNGIGIECTANIWQTLLSLIDNLNH